jgi:hypothetical protein
MSTIDRAAMLDGLHEGLLYVEYGHLPPDGLKFPSELDRVYEAALNGGVLMPYMKEELVAEFNNGHYTGVRLKFEGVRNAFYGRLDVKSSEYASNMVMEMFRDIIDEIEFGDDIQILHHGPPVYTPFANIYVNGKKFLRLRLVEQKTYSTTKRLGSSIYSDVIQISVPCGNDAMKLLDLGDELVENVLFSDPEISNRIKQAVISNKKRLSP